MRKLKRSFLPFVAMAALSLLASCQTGMIRADAIDGLVREVAARHDAYVGADATLDAAHRSTFLRSTELLTRLLDEAKAK